MEKIPPKIQYLSLAGILPILLGVIGSFDLYFIDDVVNLWLIKFSILFSALILSFLGGCLFMFEIHFKSKLEFNGLLISMCPSIWAAISIQLPISCFLLAIGFLATLERERSLAKIFDLPYWWLKMRFRLTTLMVLLLIFLGFNV